MAGLIGTTWKFVSGSTGQRSGSGTFNITGRLYHLNTNKVIDRSFTSDDTYKYIHLTNGNLFAFTDSTGKLKTSDTSTTYPTGYPTGFSVWFADQSTSTGVYNPATARRATGTSYNINVGQINNLFIEITGGSDANSAALETWLTNHAVKTVAVTDAVTNGTVSPLTANIGSTYTGTITPDAGYQIPASITVGTKTYSVSSTGVFNVPTVRESITITGECSTVRIDSYDIGNTAIDDPQNDGSMSIRLVNGSYDNSKWNYVAALKFNSNVYEISSGTVTNDVISCNWTAHKNTILNLFPNATSKAGQLILITKLGSVQQGSPAVIADFSFTVSSQYSAPTFLSGLSMTITPKLRYHNTFVTAQQLMDGLKNYFSGSNQKLEYTMPSNYASYIQARNPDRTMDVAGGTLTLTWKGNIIYYIRNNTASMSIDSITPGTDYIQLRYTDPRGFTSSWQGPQLTVVSHSIPKFTGLTVNRDIENAGESSVSGGFTFDNRTFPISESETSNNALTIRYIVLTGTSVNASIDTINETYMGTTISPTVKTAVLGTDYTVSGNVATLDPAFMRTDLNDAKMAPSRVVIWATDSLASETYGTVGEACKYQAVISSTIVPAFTPLLALVGPTSTITEEGFEFMQEQRVAVRMPNPTMARYPLHVWGNAGVKDNLYKCVNIPTDSEEAAERHNAIQARAPMQWNGSDLTLVSGNNWGNETVIVNQPVEATDENASTINIGDVVVHNGAYIYTATSVDNASSPKTATFTNVKTAAGPSTYLKSATSSGDTLTIQNQNDQSITFSKGDKLNKNLTRKDWNTSSSTIVDNGTVEQKYIIVNADHANVIDLVNNIPATSGEGKNYMMNARTVLYFFPIINGNREYSSYSTFYAPTDAGTDGYTLGWDATNSKPTWVDKRAYMHNLIINSSSISYGGSTYSGTMSFSIILNTDTPFTADSSTAETQFNAFKAAMYAKYSNKNAYLSGYTQVNGGYYVAAYVKMATSSMLRMGCLSSTSISMANMSTATSIVDYVVEL